VASGAAVTTRPLVAKNPERIHADRHGVFTSKIDGNTLWITETRSAGGRTGHELHIKLTRLE